MEYPRLVTLPINLVKKFQNLEKQLAEENDDA